MTREARELPTAWTSATLGDVAEFIRGVTYSKPDATNVPSAGTLPILRATNIKEGTLALDEALVYLPAGSIGEQQYLREGDVVVATSSGSPSVVGKSAPLRAEWTGGFGAFCGVLRPSSEIEPLYIAHYVSSPQVRARWSAAARGTNINNLKRGDVLETPIPLAPPDEQRRIVAAIEEFTSRVDSGEGSLLLASRRLRQMESALLHNAVAGDLVKQRGDEEPASRLLNRLGLFPMFTESTPEGWCHVRLGDLAKVGSGATPNRSRSDFYEGGTIPWVTSKAVNSEFVTAATEFITERALTETSVRLWPAHTLLVAMYGEGKTRGKCSELLIEATTNQACAALVFEGERGSLRPFIKLFLSARYEQNRRLASGGVQPNLSLGLIKDMLVPIPPLDEQARILQEVDRVRSGQSAIRHQLEQAMLRSNRLRRSVLHEAYSGQLLDERGVVA